MPPILIRYDRQRLWRSLAVTFVLGTVSAGILAWMSASGRAPLARILSILGVPPAPVTFALVEGVTLAIVVYVIAHAAHRNDEIRLVPEGVRVHDACGNYQVAWDEIAASGEYLTMAGVRLRDRACLLARHEGTAEQRALLATREPYGEYDLAFNREQLDCGVPAFLAAVERYRSDPAAREELRGEVEAGSRMDDPPARA